MELKYELAWQSCSLKRAGKKPSFRSIVFAIVSSCPPCPSALPPEGGPVQLDTFKHLHHQLVIRCHLMSPALHHPSKRLALVPQVPAKGIQHQVMTFIEVVPARSRRSMPIN